MSAPFVDTLSIISSPLLLLKIIYAPALAFNQTTGMEINTISIIIASVCIFYTCLGGMKAVVWSDLLQGFFMHGVMLLIIIKGTINVGGFAAVIQKNLEGGRIEAPE